MIGGYKAHSVNSLTIKGHGANNKGLPKIDGPSSEQVEVEGAPLKEVIQVPAPRNE